MGVISESVVNLLIATSFLMQILYPEVRRDNVVDNYFGVEIADPYRWLEDPGSPETKKFVKEEMQLTESFLTRAKSRNAIRERLTSVANYPKTSSVQKVCGKYYTLENTGIQNQSVMYVRTSLEDKDPKVFLDPNTFSDDGTIALDPDSCSWSKDGKLFVYATAQSGSDWKTIHFMDASTGQHLKDKLKYTKWPTISWTLDGLGVFYSRYPATAEKGGPTTVQNAMINYHRIGSAQKDDILIYQYPKSPERFLQVMVSECGEYLIIDGQEFYGANTIHVACLKHGINENLKDKLIPVFPNPKEALYFYVTNEGPTFLFMTSKDAPNYKLITVTIDENDDGDDAPPTTNGTCSEATEGNVLFSSTFMKEDDKRVINWVSVVDTHKFVVCYLEDVKNTLELRDLRTSKLIHKFDFPAGTISQFFREDNQDFEFFFRFENFMSPVTVYHCQVHDLVSCSILSQVTVPNLDLKEFITEQVFYPSKDGTLIPMYILRKKDTVLNGTTPVILYGYGGYGISVLQTFSTTNLVFVDNFNGIYALANIRGGGEYGERWHVAGSLLNKQNVFDDFHAAAEYLIKYKYTSSSKLSIRGGSNGGLLIGACVNQRPELYGAAIAQVGVMDMLRFQKFTNGYAWCSEFGCSDNKTEFEYILKYSPLHNIRVPTDEGVQYPSVLVTTADHDDRVVPAHSYKYIAELQYTIGRSPRQTNPLLLRVDTKAGHGSGKPMAKQIEESTDIFAFLSITLDAPFRQTECGL